MKIKKEKMKQIIHYIINSCKSKNNFGKTVLFKLLYFSDFNFFELNELSITNETYLKYPKGPFPKHFEALKNELIQEDKINEKKEPIFKGSKYLKYNYISLKEPNIDLIDENEIKTINNVIDTLSHMTAAEISDYSHKDIPWRGTEDYKKVEYELVFYRNDPYSVKSHAN
jgi:uncharacterized phage-associated protein